MSDQTAFQGDEEGAIQNMPGDHSDDRPQLFDILGQCSHCWWSAGGEEQAGRPQTHSGGLPEGAGGGTEANFNKALRR